MSETADRLPVARGADAFPGARAPSERYILASLAHDVALGVPGVLGTDSGPGGTYVTASGEHRLTGVICAAVPGGGFDISLSLICALVDLNVLAERVRSSIVSAAERSDRTVGRVDVHVAQVTAEPVG